jgi:hypothetical protein
VNTGLKSVLDKSIENLLDGNALATVLFLLQNGATTSSTMLFQTLFGNLNDLLAVCLHILNNVDTVA